MTNLITKVMHNGTQYDIGGVTSVNGQTGAVTVEPGITKIFTLASTSDLTTAQQAYDWYSNGGNPILLYDNGYYSLVIGISSKLRFARVYGNDVGSSTGAHLRVGMINLNLSSGSVTSITQYEKKEDISDTVPTSGDNNTVTFVI